MQRILLRAILIVILAAATVYAVDAVAWHIRNTRGNATAGVTVSQVSAASLKRNREEYYFAGSITITCAQSLFPQLTSTAWTPPCWYIRRNTVQVTHL